MYKIVAKVQKFFFNKTKLCKPFKKLINCYSYYYDMIMISEKILNVLHFLKNYHSFRIVENTQKYLKYLLLKSIEYAFTAFI